MAQDQTPCADSAAYGADQAVQVVATMYGDPYTTIAQSASASAINGTIRMAQNAPGQVLTQSVCSGAAYGATLGATLGAISMNADVVNVEAAAQGAAEGAIAAAIQYQDTNLSLQSGYVLPGLNNSSVNYVPLMTCPTMGAASGAIERTFNDPYQTPETTYQAAYYGSFDGVSYYVTTGNHLCNELMNQARSSAIFYGMDQSRVDESVRVAPHHHDTHVGNWTNSSRGR